MQAKILCTLCISLFSGYSFAIINPEQQSEPIVMKALSVRNLDNSKSVTFALEKNNGSIANITLSPNEGCYVNEMSYMPTTSGYSTQITTNDGSAATIKRKIEGSDGDTYTVYLNQAVESSANGHKFYVLNADSWAIVDSSIATKGTPFAPHGIFNGGKNVDYNIGIAPATQKVASSSKKGRPASVVYSCEDKASGFGNAS